MAVADQQAVAVLLGLTPRRIRQLDAERDPIPRDPDGRYNIPAVLRWRQRRAIVAQRGESAARLWADGQDLGRGEILYRLRDELAEVLGLPAEAPTVVEGFTFERRIDPDRRDVVAGFRERAAAARDKEALAKLIAAYLDDLVRG